MNIAHDTRATWITETLQKVLEPTKLIVIDQGWQHIGHAEEGAGHFKVQIASPQFKARTLVECHQLVYKALGDAIGNTIHALQIEIHPESEA
jgi:BolA family transcriptional regulator, general stress-responsive regulator